MNYFFRIDLFLRFTARATTGPVGPGLYRNWWKLPGRELINEQVEPKDFLLARWQLIKFADKVSAVLDNLELLGFRVECRPAIGRTEDFGASASG